MNSIIISIILSCLQPLPVARELTLSGHYEESQVVLASFTPTRSAFNTHTFLSCVNHFALNHRTETQKSLKLLQSSFDPLSTREAVLADLMDQEVAKWKADDLGDIARDMVKSRDRLQVADTGKPLQATQAEIVRKLDLKIKELEDTKKKAATGESSSGQESGEDGNQPSDASGKPSRAADKAVTGGDKGLGAVDEKKLRSYEEVWGKLPEAERKKVAAQIVRDYPPKFRPMVEDYFKSLNKMNGFK